jgi:hypothetical protein
MKLLNNQLGNIDNTQHLNSFVESFSDSLTEICSKSFKTSGIKENRNSNNWWCQQLTNKRNQLNNSRRKYQRCQSERREQLREHYLCVRSQYKQLINKTKIDSWNDFVEKNTRENPWSICYALSKNKITVENSQNWLILMEGF